MACLYNSGTLFIDTAASYTADTDSFVAIVIRDILRQMVSVAAYGPGKKEKKSFCFRSVCLQLVKSEWH